jgi:hypothetical protein
MSKLIATLLSVADQDAEPNSRGNTIYRITHSTGRYCVDFADDFTAEGWEQFDTDQDASYFGVWLNKSKLMFLSYCEGDWCLAACPDVAHYNAEVEAAIQFHGEGFIAKGYSESEGWTVWRQDRSKFLISV